MTKQTTVSKQEIQELVITRLRALSPKRKISIGLEGEFTKNEMIKRVKANDPVGKKIVAIHLSYLRSLKKDIFS
jgi:hypothetical protein